MTYQFKYLELPETKRERGGGGFKVVKTLLELVVLFAAVVYSFHVYTEKTSGQTAAALPPAAISQAAQAGIMPNAGFVPDPEVLEEAQAMAQQFMATSDLSQFEKHTATPQQDLGF